MLVAQNLFQRCDRPPEVDDQGIVRRLAAEFAEAPKSGRIEIVTAQALDVVEVGACDLRIAQLRNIEWHHGLRLDDAGECRNGSCVRRHAAVIVAGACAAV